MQDVNSAFQASLDRSRRRRSLAERLRTRRRRTRGGTGMLAASVAVLALAAPLALASGGGATAGPLLTDGVRGDAVGEVQRALGVSATGVYDRATRRAVRAFQRAHGLEVDGIVGPVTRGALGLGSAAAPAATAAGTGGATGWAIKPTVGAALQRIAACESGGNPAAVSPDGRYRGKYQFSRATWRQMGGHGDPAKASEAEQDQRAATLYAQSGPVSWPVCG
jgi:hypothetical protein